MDISQAVLDANSFPEFNPMQLSALKANPFEGNLIISSPTASGKTIIAELCALHSIMNNKRKVIYTCPLRALASEHYNDFKRKYAKEQGIRITISTGDLDSSSSYLQDYDLIFTTYEKLDSLIRHRAEWLSAVGLLMIDEVHELDSNRGATLEVLITKMLSLNPKLQLLALSATIPNAKEIAKWLNAKLVESDFRPVKLREGIYFNEEIIFDEKKKQKEIIDSYKEPLHSIVKNTLELKNKQALIFANTRKRAESIAKNLAPLTEKMLIEREKAHLKRKSAEALNVLEAPTEQCALLASLIEKGIAFHHAGLLQKQREIIEELFKSNCIKIISATPTLASGVNLPAFRVIIPSLYRYEETYGQQRIPVREYKQMSGRAGRPKFDTSGESILIARSEDEVDELFENYVNGKIEEITSKLGIAPLLRMHVLSAISDNFIFDLDSMEKFFSKTFYAHQYKNLSELFVKIQEIISELQEIGFVESDAKSIKATKLGRRVSELYLDPISAYKIILALQQQRKKYGELFYLYALANTSEFTPLISAQKEKQAELYELAEEQKTHLPVDFDKEQYQDPDILKKFSTSLLLQDWVDEISEQSLTKTYNIQPGILHSKLRIADWLLYSALELAKLLGTEQHFSNLQKLRKRMEAGIKEELIALCEVRHIGRVRARRLFSNNIKGIGDLKGAPFESISRILGSAVAAKVKEQLGQEAQIPEEFRKSKKSETEGAGQKALNEF